MLGLVVFVAGAGTSRVPVIAAAFGVLRRARAARAGPAPPARSAAVELREVWPEAVDNLASARARRAVAAGGADPARRRAGRSSCGRRSGGSGRTTGRPAGSPSRLDRLKDDLADPVGDRVVEALRMAREVGGTDLGRLLRTLSAFLREDARTRAELRDPAGLDGQRRPARAGAPRGRCCCCCRRSPRRSRRTTAPAGALVLLVGGGVSLRGLPGDAADRAGCRTSSGCCGERARRAPALGLLAGGGLWLAATGTPYARRPTLDDRLAPYLRDAPRPSRLLAADRRRSRRSRRWSGCCARCSATWCAAVERWVGGLTGVRRRLEQLGGTTTVEQFRAEQVLWGGFGLAAALGLALLQRRPRRPPARCCVLGAARRCSRSRGVLGRDRWLTRQVARREERMLEEFPTVAELLALAVTAGEGPVGALERVHRLSAGELGRELGRALAEARAGTRPGPGARGRRRAAPRCAPLARFVDGVAIAVERGTPLADVLRAQAVDVREAGKRAAARAAPAARRSR